VSPVLGPLSVQRDGSTGTAYAGPGSWKADAADFPALRELWHDRLTGPVASVSLAPPIAALAVLPVVWLWLTLARITSDQRTAPGFVPLPRQRPPAARSTS
jgi:hypothetical protein